MGPAIARGVQVIRGAALDAADRGEAAVRRDVGGLRRPRGNRPEPGRHEHVAAAGRRCRGSVGQQRLERRGFARFERARHLDEVPEPRREDPVRQAGRPAPAH